MTVDPSRSPVPASRSTGIVLRALAGGLLMLGGTTYANADDWQWQAGGRIQVDAATFDADRTPLAGDVILRRARVKLNGGGDYWSLKLQYELSDGLLEPKSLWFAHQWDEGATRLTLGHMKEPFGLQQSTSSRYNTFMERALPDVFSPGFHLGALLEHQRRHWAIGIGWFGDSLGERHDTVEDGEAVLVRLVATPRDGAGKLLHLGVSAEYRRFDDGGKLRLRERPESRVTDVRFVDTGRLKDVEDSHKYALEAAFTQGRFSFQTELIGARLSRMDDAGDLQFDGSYLQASWFLTGESRDYRAGVFRGVEPLRRGGAIELAARYSRVDLRDNDVDGGRQRDVTFGINWYAREWLRLSLNHVWVDVTPAGGAKSERPRILQLRLQAYH